MKNFYIISWIVYGLGMIFQLMHWPGSDIMLLFACLLLLIHFGLFFFIPNTTSNSEKTAFLAITLITTYVTFRLVFLPFSYLWFWSALGCSVLSFIFLISTKTRLKWIHYIVIFLLVLSSVLVFVKGDQIFYFKNARYMSEKSNPCAYGLWDKYSWFLYCSDKTQEALDANQKAIDIVTEKGPCNPFLSNKENTLQELEHRKEMILEKNWNGWHSLQEFAK